MSLSPLCTVNRGAVPADVTAGASTEIELAVPAGALFWGIVAIDADETTDVATINASLVVDQITKKATFTAPATLGSAVTFQSTVGASAQSTQGSGRDVNGVVQPTWTATFKVNVKTAAGLRVLCANETFEQNSASGWIEEINQAIRLASSGTVNVVPPWVTANAGTPGGILTLTHGQSGSAVRTDTTGGTLTTVKLPATPTDGDVYEIIDATKQWAAHPLVLDGNGHSVVDPTQIGGTGATAATITLSVIRGSVVAKYDALAGIWQIGVN